MDRVNIKECKYYCNGKCERYEEFVEADYANYSVKCICEKENDLGTYDICDYQQLQAKEQECEELNEELYYWINGEYCDNKCNVVKELDQLKAENEVLEKVNKANQEKIKKLNEQLEEEFIAKQYGDEALFFTLIDVKQLAKQYTEVGVSGQSMAEQYKLKGKEELAKQILQICEVIDV